MFRLIAQDGTQYPLERPVTVIGREGCDITLAGDESVSRQHAQLELRGDVLIISDLGSSNGTFVNRTWRSSTRPGFWRILSKSTGLLNIWRLCRSATLRLATPYLLLLGFSAWFSTTIL